MTTALTAAAIACAVGTGTPAASAAQQPGLSTTATSSQISGARIAPIVQPLRSSWS